MSKGLAVDQAAIEASPRPTHGPMSDGYIGAIDGLRAIAVLSVMVCHLQRTWLPGGFTGVDVFFVISGFVVTLSMVDQQFERVRDMVAFFYARRLRRIAPALIAMLLVATLATVMFVPDAWLSEAIPSTGVAAFFGLSNVSLAAQTEVYFAPRAEFNTFLHTWSLGVEEQFYLVFPALIALVTVARLQRWRWRVVAILAALSAMSLAYCAWVTSRAPVSAFFLLPARFWELGIGMVLALTLQRWRPALASWPRGARDRLAAVALVILAATFALATETAFPFPWALAPVVATLVLIAVVSAGEGHVAGALTLPPVAYVGRISYSLYLWHWPVYVLMRWTCGLDSAVLQIIAILLSFAFAALSYRFVEQPFRRSTRLRRWPRVAIVGLGLGALVASAGLARAAFTLTSVLSLSQTSHAQVWSPFSAPPADGACRALVATRWEQGVKILDLSPRGCGAPALGRLIVAGDSHAGAYLRLLRELTEARRIEVSIYASPGCAFMDLLTPVAALAESCQAANRAIRDAILARVQAGDIVFLPSLRMHRYRSEDKTVIDFGPTIAPPAAFEEARAFVAALVAHKVKVVLEAPKPVFKSPPFRCVDWFDRMNPICTAGFSEGSRRLRAPPRARPRPGARARRTARRVDLGSHRGALRAVHLRCDRRRQAARFRCRSSQRLCGRSVATKLRGASRQACAERRLRDVDPL